VTVCLSRFRALNPQRFFFWAGCLALSLLLGCGSSPRVKPADVGVVPNSLRLQTAWTFAAGAIDIPLAVNVQANGLALANGRGAVWALKKKKKKKGKKRRKKGKKRENEKKNIRKVRKKKG